MASADPRRRWLAGLGAGMLCVLIWSAWPGVSRIAVTGSLAPYDVAALRYLIAGLVLLPVLLKRGLGMGRRGWAGLGRAALLTATAGVPYSLIAYGGLRYAPVGHAAVMIPGMTPLCSALLAWLLLGEGLGRRQLAGFGIILAGVVLLGWHGLGVAADEGAWRGDLLFLACAVVWSVYTVATRVWALPVINTTTVIAVASMVVYLPLYFGLGLGAFWQAPWQELVIQGIYQGLLMSIAALHLFTVSVVILGVAPAAVLGAAMPAFTTLLAVPILGEWPDATELVGVAVVTVGLVVIMAAPWRREPAPQRA